MRKSGSLVVAWDAAQLAQLGEVLRENAEAGDVEAELLSAEEV